MSTQESAVGSAVGSAVVTGGSRGIGRAVALRLAQDGFDVAFCYRTDESAALETARLVQEQGRQVFHQPLDVTEFEPVQAFVRSAEEKLGPLSVAVSCAGVTRDRSLALMPPEDWSTVLRTNLDGAFHISRSVLFGMLRRRAGSLVMVSSVAGLSGKAGQANYSASKAGMHGLSASLSREVAPYGIRVNVVAPGFIDSDMTAALSPTARERAERSVPMARFGRPDQVADAVSFLVSDRAAYITGAILPVDGGLRA